MSDNLDNSENQIRLEQFWLKVQLNSWYGFGRTNNYFITFQKEISDKITANGQKLLKIMQKNVK